MPERFQIEEMVFQDERGVVFRARDKDRDCVVALRRFFLEREVLEALVARGDDGRSAFVARVERLRDLRLPRLRRVIAAGVDELDGTPFVVTDWWDGKTVEDSLAEGELAVSDGEELRAQAEELLAALPTDLRRAVSFEEDEVIVETVEGKKPLFSFWICPLRYFRREGSTGSAKSLEELVGQFPQKPQLIAAGAAREVRGSVGRVAAEPLKSAQTRGGGWGWMMGVLLVAVVG
ncbi:MAG: hypothetical protein AAGC74_13375, partial [Verrucomicrobiota bacterium]